MMHFRQILGPALAALLIGSRLWAEPVTIFAASSLKTALDEVIARENLDAIAVYGGSAAIARQVAQGAEADIVILAHQQWMAWLDEQEMLEQTARCDVIGNTLVLAGPADALSIDPDSAEELINALGGGRLAVGQLTSVPAGQYAAAYLDGRGWLEPLRPHLAQTSNVRLALALLARGETPLGFVYASDVTAQPNVRALFIPPTDSYPPVRYPMALTLSAKEQSALVFDIISQSQEIFVSHGFSRVPKDDVQRCEGQ